MDMKEIMDSWLEQQGFPVVTVQRINGSTFRITQQSILDVKQKRLNQLMEKHNNNNATAGNSSVKISPPQFEDDSNNSSERRTSFEKQLWHIPFTFVTDKNSTETLVWIKEKGIAKSNIE